MDEGTGRESSGRELGPANRSGHGGRAEPQGPRRPSQRAWWFFLIAFAIWNLLLFLPRHPARVTLPYSAFVTQLAADNVAQVKIVGDNITGTFKHQLAWPPAPAGSTAVAAGTTKAVPAGSSHVASAGSTAAGMRPPTYAQFATTFPGDVGDRTLMPLLQARRVEVDVSSPGTPWVSLLLTEGLPFLLILVVIVWFSRRAARSQAGLFGLGRTRARRYTADQPKVTFADVAGADESKADLAEVVDFLRHPEKYVKVGARIPRGVLLVGPPGTGKTLLARAVAGEAGVPFFSINGSEFVEMFVGVGASRVRDLFVQAKSAQPCIVFIDELDAVGRRRGAGVGATNDEREQTLNQLLVEMDGFAEHQQLILLAATNRPDVLDPALLRPGRFDRQVVVPLPDRRGREGILRIHARHIPLAPDVDFARLARTATGMSGADLANLCNEAALGAARDGRDKVTMDDFERAWEKVVMGAERPSVLSERDRRVVAYHEGGHAVVAWRTPGADPVRKVTILPHGQALGVTTQSPAEDRYNHPRSELIARIDVMLGGRVAEELVLGEITTGAESDIVQATSLARRMVTRWGMGELGPVAFDSDGDHPFLGYRLAQGRDYSETTAARIDEEIEHLIEARRAHVRELLSGARKELDEVAAALLQKETLAEPALEQILGARPPAPVRTPADSAAATTPSRPARAGSAAGSPSLRR